MKAARIALILLTLVAVAAASSNSIRPEVNTVPEPDAAIVEVCAAPEAAEAPVPKSNPSIYGCQCAGNNARSVD